MAQPRPERTHARPRTRTRTTWIYWTLIAILLVAVLIGTIWVPIYNRTTPTLGSFPFFYWYQLLWVPVVALVSWCAYALSRRAQRGTAPAGPAGNPPASPPPPTPLSAPTAAGQPSRRPAEPGPGRTSPASAPPPPLPKRQVPPHPEEN